MIKNQLEEPHPFVALRNEALFVISLIGLLVYLMTLYTHAPATAPATGANRYTQIPLYLCHTIAGPKLLAGFIDAPVTGL